MCMCALVHYTFTLIGPRVCIKFNYFLINELGSSFSLKLISINKKPARMLYKYLHERGADSLHIWNNMANHRNNNKIEIKFGNCF